MNKATYQIGDRLCQCHRKKTLHSGFYEEWEDWIEIYPDWMEIRDHVWIDQCVKCGKKSVDWETYFEDLKFYEANVM